MSTFDLRTRLLNIARIDKNKVEVTKNRAPWIKKLWPATSFPDGYNQRAPYCAAGLAYCLREWLKDPQVLAAFGFTAAQAEVWRCKSSSVFKDENSNWRKWARLKKLQILPRECILHAGDVVIYNYSHIELVTDDDNTLMGKFTAIGFNTDASASADGQGCYEKPRSRAKVMEFIRVLQ